MKRTNEKGISDRLFENWYAAQNSRSRSWWTYTLCFLLFFLVAFFPFFKNAKTFVWDLDGRDQMLPWLAYSGRWVRQILRRSIDGSFQVPFFDISIGWGDDAIGFLGSSGQLEPVSVFLSTLVPTNCVEYLYIFLVVLRLYLSGMSFLHLCRYFQKDRACSVIGCIVYLFCAYTVYCAPGYPYFINAMILLPLMIIGVEKILQKQTPISFSVTVFYAAMCGFYLLYMLGIMVAIFGFFRWLELYAKGERIKALPGILLRGGALALLGIGLSTPVLLPSLSELFSSARSGYNNFVVSDSFFVHWRYFWTRLLALITPKLTYELEWGIDYPTYAAVFFPCVFLLFASEGRKTLKRLTGIGLFALFCPVGGWFFNGFQYVSNRWTFALALLAAFAVTEMLPTFLRGDEKSKRIALSAFAVYVISSLISKEARDGVVLWIGLVFLFLNVALCLVPDKHISYRNRRAVCCLLVALNVFFNVHDLCVGGVKWAQYFQGISEETKRVEDSVELEAARSIYAGENKASRFDSILQHYNGSLYCGVPGTSIYNSTEDTGVIELWRQMEISGNVQNFKMYSTGQRPIFDTLLSVRWLIDDGEYPNQIPFGYEKVKTLDSGHSVYENKYALPLGYTYDRAVGADSLRELNGIQRQEVALQAVVLENAGSEFMKEYRTEADKLPFTTEYSQCSWEDGILTVNEGLIRMRLNCALPAGKECYVRLKGLKAVDAFDDFLTVSVRASTMVNVLASGVWKTARLLGESYPWYYGRQDYLFSLGCSDVDRDYVVINLTQEGVYQLEDIELFALPMDNYPERVEKLRAEPLEDIRMETNRISGTVDLSRDKILCLTIPFSKGWTAFVDGEKAEIMKANYAFMGLELPEGHHDIVFKYYSPGLRPGLALCTVSLVCVIVLYIIKGRKRKANGRL